MKTIFPQFPVFPLFLILLFTFSLQAQLVEDWTEPVALTDSTSNNSNPVVVVLQENGADELYMFYNKYDEPYRQIWSRKISEGMSFEQVMFGTNPDYDYRNPQVLYSDFLIFEWNIYGNFDLFGLKISAYPVSGDIFRLTNTEYDENTFFIGPNCTYNSNVCCWESEGNIYYAEPQESSDTLIFAEIEMIDSGNCYDPVCKEDYVAWKKIENNESHIFYSEKSGQTLQWSDPAAIIDTGNNINLSLSIMPVFGGGDFLCWQADNRIYFSDLHGYDIYSPEIPGIENYYEPVAFDFLLVTDFTYGFYSFAGEAESLRDIYIADENMSNYILNISADNYTNKNPRLFIGRNVSGYDDYEIINIWQTEINGHEVLFSSYAVYNVVIGNIDENELSQIHVFPNPVSNQATIKINIAELSNEKITISILNNQGQKVDEIGGVGNNSNEMIINWNKGDLPSGVYYLVIETEKEQISEKFIIL